MPTKATEPRGYAATKDQLLNRLRRIEGPENQTAERTEELMAAVGRLLRRG